MKPTRREFSKTAGLLALAPWACSRTEPEPEGILVNDIHSQLTATRVNEIVPAQSLDAVRQAVARAAKQGRAVSIAGGRHAMGAQPFGSDTLMLDMMPLDEVLNFDVDKGVIEVGAGIAWPKLIEHLVNAQRDKAESWGIAQKQTGADRLSLGGALAANAHGRGLTMQPVSSDIESFDLVDASGEVKTCSREENAELFGLVAGGYGLFGIVTSLKLRLTPRRKIERVVEIGVTDDLIEAFDQRIADGYLYGDFQFSIDEDSEDFLRRGVFSCYRPTDSDAPIPEEQKQLSAANWDELLYLAHSDKAAVFDRYSEYYLSTNGQLYWSDTHQLSTYLDDYHIGLDRRLKADDKATEVITEIYVPRADLKGFLAEAAEDFRRNGVNVIYGTIRLIERDEDAFLAWAREPWACTIFNLHTVHTPQGIEHSAAAFRRLIDMAIKRGGSYFLTYHKYARREQVEACYPQFPEFLELKKKYDPEERFQSDWYRHYREMFES